MTIYNNLKVFIEYKLVREIQIDSNESEYEFFNNFHGHFLCNKCKKIHDFNINFSETELSDLSAYKIDKQRVYFNGLCPKCI